jgi:peptidoglycan/LPS O-acetylase OafA/YrhL
MTGDADVAPRPVARETWLSFIHGLRGIAAVAVAVFHCYAVTPVSDRLASVVPSALDGAVNLGFLGVDLFFIISGFVISLTLYGKLDTAGEWGRFFLRRQLRLDPPYWTAIFLSIMSAVVVNRLRPDTQAPVPSFLDVVAHLFYLQDFLGIKQIVGIFWTLCLEIQFYLFFGAVVLAKDRTPISGISFAWLMLPLFALSLACFWGLAPSPDGLFLPRWFEFFTGVILFLRWRGHIRRTEVFAYLGCLLIVLLVNPATDNEIARVTTVSVILIALMFLIAIEGGNMARWLNYAFFRYMGNISYSLYLMHAVIGIRILKIVVGSHDSVSRTLLLYVGALLVSVAAADLTFRLVELPSMRLSRRIKWRAA